MSNGSEVVESSEVKVWDIVVRVFHWSVVTCFSIAYLVDDDFITLHSWAGYLIGLLLSLRLLWGLIGTRHARFTDFVRSPGAVIGYLRSIFAGRPARHLGHNPAGGYMVIALMLMLGLTTLSGMALYAAEAQQGPLAGVVGGLSHFWIELLEEGHEFCAHLTLAMVALHLLGVLIASIQHRENLVVSMIHGRKRRVA